MNNKIGILVIHGMGSQRPFYAADLIEEISDRLGTDEGRFEWESIYWGRFLQEREEDLWKWMLKAKDPDGRALDLDWQKIRRFVIHNFGDAVAYGNPGTFTLFSAYATPRGNNRQDSLLRRRPRGASRDAKEKS